MAIAVALDVGGHDEDGLEGGHDEDGLEGGHDEDGEVLVEERAVSCDVGLVAHDGTVLNAVTKVRLTVLRNYTDNVRHTSLDRCGRSDVIGGVAV
jgi:hypothetical protein